MASWKFLYATVTLSLVVNTFYTDAGNPREFNCRNMTEFIRQTIRKYNITRAAMPGNSENSRRLWGLIMSDRSGYDFLTMPGRFYNVTPGRPPMFSRSPPPPRIAPLTSPRKPNFGLRNSTGFEPPQMPNNCNCSVFVEIAREIFGDNYRKMTAGSPYYQCNPIASPVNSQASNYAPLPVIIFVALLKLF